MRWLCSTLLASSPCACYSISWLPLSSFSLWIILSSPSLPNPPLFFPLINHCDWCLVSLAWGLMARRRRFTSHELALPKVEAPGYPGHPPPLSDALYICDPCHDHQFLNLALFVVSWSMDVCETFDPTVHKNVLPTLSIWALAIFGRFFPVSLIKACSIHGLAIQDAIFESCVPQVPVFFGKKTCHVGHHVVHWRQIKRKRVSRWNHFL